MNGGGSVVYRSHNLNPAPDLAGLVRRLEDSIDAVVRGKRGVVRALFAALLARGHVLIEDVPGVGKTTLARALAACIGGKFSRIQFTSDMLPTDILGISVFRDHTGTFEFRPGPIFANVVLADEINRTPPRTQSALMEALNDGQVTLDSHTHALDEPFMLIATQNPTEHFGTYPLPESQMDRFLLRLSIGYPTAADERRVVANRPLADPILDLQPLLEGQQIRDLQQEVERVHIDDALLDYMMHVVAASRKNPLLSLGVSTRGTLAWARVARAHALMEGRSFCVPDDIKTFAVPALAHRVLVAGQEAAGGSRILAERAVREMVDRTPVPL